jgi:hypothetical protein
MNRATRLALAVTLPVAALALAANAASAAPPPTEPPGPEVGASPPPGLVTLTDDTGTITVDVPSSWTDVDTAPAGENPWISATPDFVGFISTFDVPGVTFEAVPYTADTATVARERGFAGSCAYEQVQPYDDGLFVGSHLIDTGCGDAGTSEYHVIAANPSNQAFTALLDIQLTAFDEVSTLEAILDTFNLTDAAWAAGSLDPASATPAAPAPGGAFPAPSGEIPSGWTTLVDDTQTLQIDVPQAWTKAILAPWRFDDGSTRPAITATTEDGLSFTPAGTGDTFSAPGVQFQAFPYDPDTAARLAESTLHTDCTAAPLQTYDDGVFVGHIQSFDACGGTATRNVLVVANPADRAFTAVLDIQLIGQPDDASTLNGLLLSFNEAQIVDPGPTTSVVDTPTAPVAGGDALGGLDRLIAALQLALSDEQATCVSAAAGQLDPAAVAAAAADPFGMPAEVLVALLNCGVDVFDIPSG